MSLFSTIIISGYKFSYKYHRVTHGILIFILFINIFYMKPFKKFVEDSFIFNMWSDFINVFFVSKVYIPPFVRYDNYC